MEKHPLADLFDGASEVQAEISRREAAGTEPPGPVDETVNTYHPRRLQLVVEQVIPETPSSSTFRMVDPGGGHLPPFSAGQYVNLFVDTDQGPTSRPFAISSSPAQRDHYDLTVRRIPGGRVSNHLLDRVAGGEHLSSTGPMGGFHHNPLFHGSDVVFLAGGSGVTPAMSMIRDILDHDLPRRLHLVYGSRTDSDIIFEQALQSAAQDDRITVEHVIMHPGDDWRGPTGLLTAQTIATAVGDLADRMVYVCGPPAMYPHARAQLALLGHRTARSRFEANGPADNPEDADGWPDGLDPGEPVRVQVVGGPTFHSPRGRPLLDALEDHGMQPEAACRSGECSMCRVQVVSGTVFTGPGARPRMSDAEYGWVHSCVAYPLDDVEIAVHDRSGPTP